jgi:hypothetical protein
MSEKPKPNIGLDLQRIHRVITRGVARIAPCDIGAYEYVVRVYFPQVMRNLPQ